MYRDPLYRCMGTPCCDTDHRPKKRTKENADLVALTIMNTNTAGLAGAIVVAMIMYLQYRRFDITMILNGALGGLVAVTAGADLVGLFAFTSSFMALYIINKLIPLRASDDEQLQGLDIDECGIEAYAEFKKSI